LLRKIYWASRFGRVAPSRRAIRYITRTRYAVAGGSAAIPLAKMHFIEQYIKFNSEKTNQNQFMAAIEIIRRQEREFYFCSSEKKPYFYLELV